MHYESYTSNDGHRLAFQSSLSLSSDVTVNGGDNAAGDGEGETSIGAARDPPLTVESGRSCILLLHGFAGSSAYFERNYPTLTAAASDSSAKWVVAWDMRGHGRSAKPNSGYHVARLAADLYDLLLHLRNAYGIVSSDSADDRAADGGAAMKIVLVGCSIGAAVAWTFTELYAPASAWFAGICFVDQAPLQDRDPSTGWTERFAHRELYDEATLRGVQQTLNTDPDQVYKGLVAGCLGYRCAPLLEDDISPSQKDADEAFFVDIARQCSGKWLARLVADHTRYDHRDAIAELDVPVLVMAGERSGPFSLDGLAETVRLVNATRPGLARLSVFEFGHWLFYEAADQFNEELLDFVAECNTVRDATMADVAPA